MSIIVETNDVEKVEFNERRFKYLDECLDKYLKDYQPVATTVPNTDPVTCRHKNYLDYLDEAWRMHRSVIVAPHIIWHIILSEIASFVNTNQNDCRSLFTESEEKIDLVVPYDQAGLIDLRKLMSELKKNVPVDVSLFLPDFSTADRMSRLATMCAFAEIVSPFYNYFTCLCGIKSVKIVGNDADWSRMIDRLKEIAGEFKKVSINTVDKWIQIMLPTINKIRESLVKPDVKFWQDILGYEECGSGSEYYIRGWIKNFFMEYPRLPRLDNFPSQISSINYEDIQTKAKFRLICGLFSSEEQDGFLQPKYGYVLGQQLTKRNISTSEKGVSDD